KTFKRNKNSSSFLQKRPQKYCPIFIRLTRRYVLRIMMSNTHPVWDVYDQLRTSRLNEKYYGKRLQKYEQINFFSEIVLAVTSSAVAGFAFWNNDYGSHVWKGLLILSALIAISKPLLNLTRKIRLYEELLAGYRLLSHDFKDLKIDITQQQDYTVAHQKKFKKIIEKQKTLATKSPERTENIAVKSECMKQVLNEYPTEMFYIPE
ncbi:hypothetical protein, partial [Psychromonas hadalis]|uniref:hypothetical protein n=1 Tax=Psychromonas hadalis TaxID=211669 RepID=UPI001B7FB1F5